MIKSISFVLLVHFSLLVLSEDFKESKVSGNLINLLGQGDKSDFEVLVTFNESTESVLNQISSLSRMSTIQERAFTVTNLLENRAHSNQKSVREFLFLHNVQFRVLWICNQLYIPKANHSIINELSRFSEISFIYENPIFPLYERTIQSKVNERLENSSTEFEWGIKAIKVDLAMSLLNMSSNLPEIRVGITDTGVRWTHEAIRDSYFGTYGWFDPYFNTTLPNDYEGHGTHVAGTIAGKYGIGVYPQAKWMACRGCDVNHCTLFTLLECGQFFTCPTLPDGTSKDCSKAPHVVSNSWGAQQGGQDFYDAVIKVWHAVGIVPVFSAGNFGSECGTVGSPADRDVIAVGSVSQDAFISIFSSRGPTDSGKVKPDISAPGSPIVSSWYTSDNAYSGLQGTSMACPHVTGVVAMLLAHNQNLTYDQIRHYLFSGADRISVKPNNSSCGGMRETEFPNHVFGHGRVDAFESLKTLMGLTPGTSDSLSSGSSVSTSLWLLSCFILMNL